MNTFPNNQITDNEKITYQRIRSSIGILGISLPVVLLIFPLIPIFKTSIQNSISYYYYTNLRDIFVGVLCAVGLFLIRYKGFKSPVIWKNDSLLTNIAGTMAFGIALFPTNPNVCAQKLYTIIPECYYFIGVIHYIFAVIFFLVLAIISINIFTIGQKENIHIPVSIINENYIYRTCGYLMIFALVLIPILAAFKLPYTTLICETLTLFSFGTSWLIKGRALGDKGKLGKMIYREDNK